MRNYISPSIKIRAVSNELSLMAGSINGKDTETLTVKKDEITTQEDIGAKKNFNLWEEDE